MKKTLPIEQENLSAPLAFQSVIVSVSMAIPMKPLCNVRIRICTMQKNKERHWTQSSDQRFNPESSLFVYGKGIFFGPSPQLVRPKKISHGKPEIFSGFLRFSPFFSLLQNLQNSQNKKISFAKNDWSEGFELLTSPFWHRFQRFLSKKRTNNEAINC